MLWKRSARPLDVRFGARSDVGRVRTENQDHYGRFPEAGDCRDDCLFVVADGMGGHDEGGWASRVTVEVLGEAYFAQPEVAVADRLRAAIVAANHEVFEWAHAGGAARKMGTTCTALALVGGEAWLAHVGDSRAYRIGEARIEQLSQDHTLVDALRREGVLTEAEAERHPQRHALTRAVGVEPDVEVDVQRLDPPRSGDRFLLCSDGLARVTDAEVRDLVRADAPQAAADRLVALANERGGHDNVTVVIVEVR